MGKHSGGELGELVDLQDGFDALHEARDVLRIAAVRLLMSEAAPDRNAESLAGVLLVMAERVNLAAVDARVRYVAKDEAAPHNVVPAEKAKRVRGPRKPKASAAEQAQSQSGDDDMTRTHANGGA